MKHAKHLHLMFAAACLTLVVWPEPASAYIGPGAGIAVGTTVFAFLAAMLSGLAALLLWPFRWLLRSLRRRRAHAKARVKRVVILGLDGMEPTLAEKYMAEGRLPNLQRLKEQGTFTHLGTTLPPLSPVAWSTFLTGCNPGKHGIFDFLTRDRRTYLPLLSSVRIRPPTRALRMGKYRIPLGRPEVRLLRHGKPFWNTLGEHGIFSNVIRVPITFPPERFRGVLLSAMCVPDLRGSQGTFTFYTTRPQTNGDYTSGEAVRVQRQGKAIRAQLIGPPDPAQEDGEPMRCPFEITTTGPGAAVLKIAGQSYPLAKGRYTPWIRVVFRGALRAKVTGICEFLLRNTEPEFELYVTPIQIDPDRPVLPISHPNVYATYLSKAQGPYATLGLAEDTWALNAGILDDDGFLHQCLEADAEREKMFFDALDKVRHGLCVCVFDGTDRIQHMFWRYIDPQHPAPNGHAGGAHPAAIDELYARMDQLVGRTMKACSDPDTVLMVISDHGFNSFRRGVDLNVWLEQNGYLVQRSDQRGRKYLAGIDWSRTKAYCLGLAGIWLNLQGREQQGIVPPSQADALREEMCAKLTGLRDEQHQCVAISRAFNATRVYDGPYRADGPDIIVGYARGYRVSWEAAIGQPTEQLFQDNVKAWSGDHCIDPKLVPGVLFCNRRIDADAPRLIDIGPTVLSLFGVPISGHLDGTPLSVADDDGTFPAPPDPTRPNRSGRSPVGSIPQVAEAA